jgi:iron complex outermembrane receptor protein
MNLEISLRLMGAKIAALFIGVFLGSAAAVAESSSSAAAGAEGQIEEIVVTAQRRDQDVQDVPISMTALSGDTLNVYRLEQARQLASVVPNLNVLQTY